MTPEEAGRRRIIAIESLQEQLAAVVSDMERELLQGLLSRLQDVQADPALLATLLDEFTQAVHLPVLTFAGQALLQLPTLTLDYFGVIGVEATDYTALRAPLTSYIQQVFGLDTNGVPLPSGLLYTYAGDQTVKRELLAYGYRALTSGVGLVEYRAGLTQLVTGGADSGGLYTRLYRSAYDNFNQADRVLQTMAAEELGFSAYLYLGGLIASSRKFCKQRNGKVFLRSEIEAWKSLSFDGKPDPYEPMVQLGGYGCRHGLNAVPNTVALSMRSDLKEDGQNRLYVAE